jgi:histidinol-phosphatase (PHP family)
VNLHTHTTYCDGKSSPLEIVNKAIALNWKFIGFSAHAPLPFPCEWCLPVEKVSTYCKTIKDLQVAFKPQIQIHHGFEIDYLAHWGYPCLKNVELNDADYFICSIHYLPSKEKSTSTGEYRYYEIDGTYAQFMLALKEYNYSLKKLLSAFLHSTEGLMSTPLPNNKPKIIGHIDKIVLHAIELPEFEELKDWFYMELLQLSISNRGNFDFIEINTRAMYHKGLSNPYPHVQLIELLQANLIPLMFNSDAHHRNELDAGIDDCIQLIASYTAINTSQIQKACLPIN